MTRVMIGPAFCPTAYAPFVESADLHDFKQILDESLVGVRRSADYNVIHQTEEFLNDVEDYKQYFGSGDNPLYWWEPTMQLADSLITILNFCVDNEFDVAWTEIP